MRQVAAGIALLLSVPVSISMGQGTPTPAAGTWAAEIGFGGGIGPGGSLLRFRSERTAWLFGLAFNLANLDEPFDSEGNRTVWIGDAKLGFRSLRSPGSPIRPVLGAGLVGSYGELVDDTRWGVGAYGEFGALRFFGSGFSLAALAELRVQRTEEEETGPFGDERFVATEIGFDAVRLIATLYF